MSLKDVKFIATDMDHTLLTEAGTLPPHLDERLDQLEALGIQFGIASGRPLYTLRDLFPRHERLTLIADNGAAISHHGQIISKTLLPQAAYQAMVKTISEATDGSPLICGLDGAIAATVDQQYDSVFREFYHQLSFRDDLASWEGEANKVTIYLPNGDSQKVYDEVIAPRFGADFSAAVSGPVWIDIMPKGVDKGTGMRAVSQHLHIATDDMMAFGDTFNDAEMLATVKYGYLVANHAEGMAQYARYRTASNDDYGVVQVLDQVIAAHQDARK